MFPKDEGLRKVNVTDAPSVWEGQGRHRDGGADPLGFMNAEMKKDIPGGWPQHREGGEV